MLHVEPFRELRRLPLRPLLKARHICSKEMPAGTKVVKVTLEADPEAPKPWGPEVLQAAGVYQLS